MNGCQIAAVIREYTESLFIDHHDGGVRRSEFQCLLTEHLDELAVAFEVAHEDAS